jgi:hypothetical protein
MIFKLPFPVTKKQAKKIAKRSQKSLRHQLGRKIKVKVHKI